MFFNSELNEFVGFTKKNYPAGTHLGKKPTTTTSIPGTDNLHLNCNYVYRSIVNGRHESTLFSFSLSAPLGLKIHKEPTFVLFKKVNKEKVDNKKIYLEDDDGNLLDFNGKTLMFTAMSLTNRRFLNPRRRSLTDSKFVLKVGFNHKERKPNQL